jgi:hypothetical protein
MTQMQREVSHGVPPERAERLLGSDPFSTASEECAAPVMMKSFKVNGQQKMFFLGRSWDRKYHCNAFGGKKMLHSFWFAIFTAGELTDVPEHGCQAGVLEFVAGAVRVRKRVLGL